MNVINLYGDQLVLIALGLGFTTLASVVAGAVAYHEVGLGKAKAEQEHWKAERVRWELEYERLLQAGEEEVVGEAQRLLQADDKLLTEAQRLLAKAAQHVDQTPRRSGRE